MRHLAISMLFVLFGIRPGFALDQCFPDVTMEAKQKASFMEDATQKLPFIRDVIISKGGTPVLIKTEGEAIHMFYSDGQDYSEIILNMDEQGQPHATCRYPADLPPK